MKKKEVTFALEEKFAQELQNLLNHEGCLDDAGDDEVLEKIEVSFDDGVTVEIDICNGGRDDDSSPYINVNWYDNGEDLFAFGSEPDGLLGEYSMVKEDEEENEVEYSVTLIIGENGKTF